MTIEVHIWAQTRGPWLARRTWVDRGDNGCAWQGSSVGSLLVLHQFWGMTMAGEDLSRGRGGRRPVGAFLTRLTFSFTHMDSSYALQSRDLRGSCWPPLRRKLFWWRKCGPTGAVRGPSDHHWGRCQPVFTERACACTLLPPRTVALPPCCFPKHCTSVFCSWQRALAPYVHPHFFVWKSEFHTGTKQYHWGTKPSQSRDTGLGNPAAAFLPGALKMRGFLLEK